MVSDDEKIRLPLCQKKVGAEQDKSSQEECLMAAAIRVLYVDDDPDLLKIGKQFLEKTGDFTVTTALSAPEAIRLLECKQFDAIISDYQMPDMDGIQFLIEVRTHVGLIPFILFTGRGREEIVIQAINSGADFYLQKGGEPGAQFAELTHKIKSAAARKRADDALRESEEKLRILLDTSSDPIFSVDPSGTYRYVNRAFAEGVGKSVDQIIGRKIGDVFTKAEANKRFSAFRKVFSKGVGKEIEFCVPHPGGDRYYMTTIVPVKDESGSVVSAICSSKEITSRKLEEEDFREKTILRLEALNENLLKTEADLKLHQTELEVQNEELRRTQACLEVSYERYFELYDLAPAGYISISTKGLILNTNLTAASLLGVERHQLLKKPIHRYILPCDQDIFYHCRKKLVDTKKRQSCELRMLHGLVTPFRVQIIAVPAPAGEGDESTISLMMIDIPEPETGKEALTGERIPCR